MPYQPPPNRVIRYEIAARRQARWVIHCLRADEAEAIALAEELLEEDGVEAARVVRQRHAPTEIVIETEVFRRDAAPRGKPGPALSATDDSDCWCETLADLYGARCRRVIGQLLRGFLDQLGITPLELLHNHRFAKKLESSGALQQGAIHRVAKARADATGAPVRDCARALDALVAAASGKARDALAVRAVPRVGAGGLDALVGECRRLAPDAADQLFWLRHAAARQLEPCSGLAGRLELALDWAAAAADPAAIELVDAVVADCLGSAALVQELLGPQNDLGRALCALAVIARGAAPTAPARAPSWFAALSALLERHPCPEVRASFLARLYRELVQDKPLVPRGGAADEAKALTALGEALRREEDATYLGGANIVAALARRWRRLDVTGGFGDVPLPAGAPEKRVRELLDFAPTAYGEARKRALATLILEAAPGVPATARPALAEGLAAANLPPAARAALDRIWSPAA